MHGLFRYDAFDSVGACRSWSCKHRVIIDYTYRVNY